MVVSSAREFEMDETTKPKRKLRFRRAFPDLFVIGALTTCAAIAFVIYLELDVLIDLFQGVNR
jgi:hypothetical protein